MNNRIVKNHPRSSFFCRPGPPAILFLSPRDKEPIWAASGLETVRQAGRRELNRAEQPAIHMDQVDRRSINGLPLESKTPAQAGEELLGEIRIPAAIQVSLYVFAVCYNSIFLPQPLADGDREPSLESGEHC